MDSRCGLSEIKGKILHKLTRAGKFEHSHTAIENLQRGFPEARRVKEMIKVMHYIDIFLKKRMI
ncbi:MAG: hypothetical protein QW331_02280 [Candidatus Woesearchaeota archaeon]